MTEIVSNVYDLIYSSPVGLKEISSNSVAVELWRWEINRFRVINHLTTFEPGSGVFLKTVIPDIPSAIENILEESINRFGFSLQQWLHDHSFKVFDFHRNHRNDVLNDFDDFVCDCDGSINYVSTAKKMITCDRLSDDEKLKIACMYCFENDIKRLWPSVSQKIDLNDIDFNRCPQLFYWICLLREELHKIPNQTAEDPVNEMMLDKCPFYNWSSLKYFWNRISSKNRFRKAVDLSVNNKEAFVRFFLPMLTEQELDRLVIERGSNLISALLTNSPEKFYVLPTWMYIKNKFNESNFTILVEELLETETNHHIAESASNDSPSDFGDVFSTEDETYLCCEVWKNAPEKLRRSAIRSVLQKKWLFEKQGVRSAEFREIRFLLTVLLDASFEERNTFWYQNWHNLIYGTRGKDLYRIMKLCLRNENDIAEFKRTIMTNYENIGSYCVQLLDKGCFEELDDFLIFCCSETPTRRELKQRLLQSCFLGEYRFFKFSHLSAAELMNEFINDAYDNLDQAAEFKNRLISSPFTENCLLESIRLGLFSGPVKFVNTFVLNDEIATQMKKMFVDVLKYHLMDGTVWHLKAENLQNFLVWCLGDEDEVTKFKQSMSVKEILYRVVRNQRFSSDRDDNPILESGVLLRPHNVDQFLSWYFETSEEIQQCKNELQHIIEMFSSRV